MTDVRRMVAGDRPEVLAVAARAFWSDPLFDFFARDLMHEYKVLPVALNAYLKDLESSESENWVGVHEGRPRAFAGWVVPGGSKRSPFHEARRALRLVPAVARTKHPGKAVRLFLEVDKRHPKEPHWYL